MAAAAAHSYVLPGSRIMPRLQTMDLFSTRVGPRTAHDRTATVWNMLIRGCFPRAADRCTNLATINLSVY